MAEDRTLVVTGATRGLGAHIAEAAMRSGYRVIGLARATQPDCPYEVRACDVGDSVQVSAVFKELKSDRRLYGLVNAAGIASMNLAMATPPETVERIIRTNLLGTIYCSAAMGKILVRRKAGRIVTFSTIAVPLALKGETAYIASKAGVEGFTRAFAREMADFGVTVNAVAPGPIPTDLIRNVPEPQIASVVNAQIIPRMGRKEDVWNIVSFLLSEQAGMVSGQVIHVGGV